VFLIAPFWALFSCKTDELDFDNIQVPNIQGEYVLPIGEITYTISELIENIGDSTLMLDSVPVGRDSSRYLLLLQYTDSISYSTTSDLLNVSDVDQRDTLRNIIPAGLSGGSFLIGPEVLAFTYDDFEDNTESNEEIESIFYESGLLRVIVISEYDLDYEITLNNTFDENNQSVVLTGSTPSDNPTRNLEGYKTIIEKVGDENVFSITFSANLNLANADLTTGDETIEIRVEFINQIFDSVYGYFGQDPIQIDSQIVNLDFFEDIESDGFLFGDPSVSIDFTNQFGIPLGIDFSNVFADRGDGTDQFLLNGSITETLQVVASATNPTSPTNTSLSINNSNSNIVSLLGSSPSRLVLNVGATSNPQGDDGSVQNFITSNDQIEGLVSIDIPMEIQLENVEQTGTLDLGDSLNTDNIVSADLRIVTLNELPFSGALKLEILGIDSLTMDTIATYEAPEKIVLRAPLISIDGIVTDATGTVDDIPLSAEGIEALKNGIQLKLTITLNTPGSLVSDDIFVKVLTDYKIKVQVGIGAKVDIKL